jgi:hypothetical protein
MPRVGFELTISTSERTKAANDSNRGTNVLLFPGKTIDNTETSVAYKSSILQLK